VLEVFSWRNFICSKYLHCGNDEAAAPDFRGGKYSGSKMFYAGRKKKGKEEKGEKKEKKEKERKKKEGKKKNRKKE
jgi:hypothetical protein